jgi:ATP-binding cassette subfamily B protein
MERFLNGGANDLIQVFVGSLMVGAVFFYITSSLAFLALMPIPFILYGAFWFQSRLAPRYTAVREAAGALATQLNNNLSGIATVKAYTAEEFEAEHMAHWLKRLSRANSEAIRRLRNHAGDPHGDPRRLHRHLVIRRLHGAERRNRRGRLLGAGVFTQRLLWPLDAAGRYDRSLSALDGVHPARDGSGRRHRQAPEGKHLPRACAANWNLNG